MYRYGGRVWRAFHEHLRVISGVKMCTPLDTLDQHVAASPVVTREKTLKVFFARGGI